MPHKFSAKIVLTLTQKIILLTSFALISLSLFTSHQKTLWVLNILGQLLYFFASTYRLVIYLIGIKINESGSYQQFVNDIPEDNLPTYTIMIPLFKESNMVKTLTQNLQNIIYPTNKLQILIILEEEDVSTINAVAKESLPSNFHMIIVPLLLPQTKARACNYALKYANGEIICIYDAEDRPDILQLKKVAHKFLHSSKQIVCVQCKLRFYNSNENWITNMFEIEYQNLFNYILPAVTALKYPIPLGGTSNHFKGDILKNIGGWDEYNVTEDADLGLRLAVSGYRTTMIDSFTSEESPINFKVWLNQRIRWLKGYFHTFFIYSREPKLIYERFSITGLIFVFYIILLGPFLLLYTPVMICISSHLSLEKLEYIGLLYWMNLIYGTLGLVFSSYVIKKHSRYCPIRFFWSYPIYFLLHIIAAVIAFYRLFTSPHTWEKTPHGLNQFDQSQFES